MTQWRPTYVTKLSASNAELWTKHKPKKHDQEIGYFQKMKLSLEKEVVTDS